MESQTYDIVIVGGGVAGNAMALSLKDAGLRVAVIEATPPAGIHSDSDPERTVALSYGSSCYLDRLGVWSKVRGGAARIEKVYISEPGHRGVVCMDRRQSGTEALGYVLELPLLVHILCGQVSQHTDVFCPARVTGMRQNPNRVHLRFRHEQKEQEISASLVIGADGTHSRIRGWAGIPSLGWDHNRFGLVASVRPQRPHAGAAFECFRAPGPLAFLPLDDKRCTIVWTLGPEGASRHMDMDDERFLASLSRAAGSVARTHLGRMLETGPRACFPLEFRQAGRFTSGRAALIGNAAHTIHPVAGQGLNLGLRDVETMADVLHRAVKAGRDAGEGIVLEEYADRRRLDTVAVSAFTEGLNAVFGNQCSPLRLLRGLGLDGLQRVPTARGWLMRRVSGLAGPGLIQS